MVHAQMIALSLVALLKESIMRGNSFLYAGATTVVCVGGTRGSRNAEVKQLVQILNSKVIVIHRRTTDCFSIKEIEKLDVARVYMV